MASISDCMSNALPLTRAVTDTNTNSKSAEQFEPPAEETLQQSIHQAWYSICLAHHDSLLPPHKHSAT